MNINISNGILIDAPYIHKIGKATFQVSSFESSTGTQTSEEMLLAMIEPETDDVITQPEYEKEKTA